MESDIIEKLQLFGLTVNQAKTYLVIVRNKSVTVSKIAKYTKFHRPDIYTMLPKLEKMGLITRTMGSPAVVEAIEIKKALKNLTTSEKQRALERLSKMEEGAKELADSINALSKTEGEHENEQIHFNLLTNDSEILNMAETLFDRAKDECKVVINPEVMGGRAPHIYECFQKAISKGVKIKVIIQASKLNKDVKSAIERIRFDSDNFTLKFLASEVSMPFQVIDDEVVWIGTSKKTENSKLPCVLWTNGKNLLVVYSERFEELWNNPEASILYP